MAEFKYEYCKACRFKHHEPNPTTPKPCPKCGKPMQYSKDWYIGYYYEGKKLIRVMGEHREDAKDALESARAKRRKGERFYGAPSTLWEAAAKEFQEWATINLRPKSSVMYANSLKSLTEFFRGKTLDKITSKQVEDYKQWRREHPRLGYMHYNARPEAASATINRDLSTLKRLINKCIEWRLLWPSQDTAAVLRVKLYKETPRVRFLTEDEITRLLQECRTPQLRLAVLLALQTGLGAGDVKRTNRRDIDLTRGIITRYTTRGKRVDIPITPTLREALLEHPVMGEWLFPSMSVHGNRLKDGPIGQHADLGFARACARAGITNFHFNDLRHTFASHFLMRTNDLATLQELLGHSNISTTKKYVHLLQDGKEMAYPKAL